MGCRHPACRCPRDEVGGPETLTKLLLLVQKPPIDLMPDIRTLTAAKRQQAPHRDIVHTGDYVRSRYATREC